MICLLHRVFLGAVVSACLLGVAIPARASTDADGIAATRLVQAELPRGTSLLQADGESMSRAVSRAILEHRAQAPAILSAALVGGVSAKSSGHKQAAKRPCDFVVRVFQGALLAAPEQASELSEVAVALCPDCADQLAAVLQTQVQRVAAYDYKDKPDYKDRADYKDRTDHKDTADYKDRSSAPVAGISDLGAGLDDPGFGVGFGPGFPGAPGFVGSAPSGGFALPPAALPDPGGVVLTPVTNE